MTRSRFTVWRLMAAVVVAGVLLQGLRITMGRFGDSVKADNRLPRSGSGLGGPPIGMIFRQDNPTLSRTIPMARDRDVMPLPTDPTSILEHFALLPDPRREHGLVHRLDEVVF